MEAAPGPPTPLHSTGPAAPRPPSEARRWALAGLLFVTTFLTTTTLGAVWVVSARTDLSTPLGLVLLPETIVGVWRDPQMLALGLGFSLPLLTILLCHELGHYLACRHYGIPATPPYFLPVPLALGTFGAFIRIRSPIRRRRELFDIGIAGPIAGFVALLPFLLWGVARSPVAPVLQVPAEQANYVLNLPGRSLAFELATWIAHGRLPPGSTLDYHPFALAAWFGLLATALNLLPVGQLDGGHVLFAVDSRLHRKMGVPVLLALVAFAVLWPGWLVWAALVLALSGLRHPPVAEGDTPLDPKRQRLALVALAMLVASFMPIPLAEVPVNGGAAPPGTVLASLEAPRSLP